MRHIFQHPDPEIEKLAQKHYDEDPETKRLVDEILNHGATIEVPLEYHKEEEN